MDIFQAIILGIIEGLTEFLPVSSTGHMILVGHFLGIDQKSDFVKSFEIAIQLGSILAVFFVLYQRLLKGLDLWCKLIIAFIPTGIIGLIAYKYVKEFLIVEIVPYMLIIGGIVFLWVEYRGDKKQSFKQGELETISYKQAFIIGLFQSLAMIPGTSRSGVTIVTGLLMGLSRTLAAEFSFLLAIPTMFAATGFTIYKDFSIFTRDNLVILLIGGFVAFITALLSIKLFLKFISRFNYVPFGIYRILIGAVLLVYFWKF